MTVYNRVTLEVMDTAREMLKSGYRLKNVARELGVSYNTLQNKIHVIQESDKIRQDIFERKQRLSGKAAARRHREAEEPFRRSEYCLTAFDTSLAEKK